MQLQTYISLPKPDFEITHEHALMSLGSCFSENIGRYFEQLKFPIIVNPFGQQYNPASIAQGIERLLNPVPYTETDLLFHNEQFHSFDHHSDFSRSTPELALETMNMALKYASEHLRQTNVLFITLGTSFCFEWKENQKIVSNCHKIPAKNFERILLSSEKTIEILSDILIKLMTVNPRIKVVFTVSPVRYLAFGAFENSVSKGNLFSAINTLLAKYTNCSYFPAYEIVMDELRDYRYYSEDMIHPNSVAVNYVFEKMTKVYFSPQTQDLNRQIREIIQAGTHRPRNPESVAHKEFLSKYVQKIQLLCTEYPLLDFQPEMKKLMQ